MNIAELEERIDEINMIDKAFEMITDNQMLEAALLVTLDDNLDRLRRLYTEKLEEVKYELAKDVELEGFDKECVDRYESYINQIDAEYSIVANRGIQLVRDKRKYQKYIDEIKNITTEVC